MTGSVLLTGASGLVGVEVAARLEGAGVPVTAVLHAARALVGNDGAPRTVARRVEGDVRVPGLGLTDDAATAAETALIVHCAATTAFDATDEEYERLNVAGARHAVELALAWDVPLVHVSTAYVCGLRGGLVLEDELDLGQEFGTCYERSKLRAEQIVEAARARGCVPRWCGRGSSPAPPATARSGITRTCTPWSSSWWRGSCARCPAATTPPSRWRRSTTWPT
ncbi:hypothetical protein MTP03_09680 [Tsukamurella sp. PLM1]|nr:hypothetical protein MTP03_09680 [Tsukamurella sp. PLM1]